MAGHLIALNHTEQTLMDGLVASLSQRLITDTMIEDALHAAFELGYAKCYRSPPVRCSTLSGRSDDSRTSVRSRHSLQRPRRTSWRSPPCST